MVFLIAILTIAAMFAAMHSKPKRRPCPQKAGFLGAIAGAFSDGGKKEALARQRVGENAIYAYGDEAKQRLGEEMGRISGDLSGERGIRDREFGRVLGEASHQRQQLDPYIGLGRQGVSGLSQMLMNPGQLSAGGQFQMQQAMAQGSNTAAAMGSRRSGATAAALQDRAQGIAQMDRASQMQEQLAAIGVGQQGIGMQRFAGPAQDYVSQLLASRGNMAGNQAATAFAQGQGIAGINDNMASTIVGSTAQKNGMISGGLNMLGGAMLNAGKQAGGM